MTEIVAESGNTAKTALRFHWSTWGLINGFLRRTMLRREHYTNRILQGDPQKASDCRSIAKLQVKGISPAQKRGEPKIKVTFEVEPSGVFQCRARELPDQRLLVEGQPARIDIERSY